MQNGDILPSAGTRSQAGVVPPDLGRTARDLLELAILVIDGTAGRPEAEALIQIAAELKQIHQRRDDESRGVTVADQEALAELVASGLGWQILSPSPSTLACDCIPHDEKVSMGAAARALLVRAREVSMNYRIRIAGSKHGWGATIAQAAEEAWRLSGRSKPEPGVTGAGQPADGEAVAEEQQQEEPKWCRGSVGDFSGRMRCAYCGHTDPCYCRCPGGKYSHDPFSDEGGADPSAEGDVESQAPGGG